MSRGKSGSRSADRSGFGGFRWRLRRHCLAGEGEDASGDGPDQDLDDADEGEILGEGFDGEPDENEKDCKEERASLRIGADPCAPGGEDQGKKPGGDKDGLDRSLFDEEVKPGVVGGGVIQLIESMERRKAGFVDKAVHAEANAEWMFAEDVYGGGEVVEPVADVGDVGDALDERSAIDKEGGDRDRGQEDGGLGDTLPGNES